jgi:hypothetical protein
LSRSGAGDNTAKNIINVPLMPLWRLATSGLDKDKAVTRGRARKAEDKEEGNEGGEGSGFGAGVTAASVRWLLSCSVVAFRPGYLVLKTREVKVLR